VVEFHCLLFGCGLTLQCSTIAVLRAHRWPSGMDCWN
jgi:hypothetical protein